jgi:hypothetical protein
MKLYQVTFKRVGFDGRQIEDVASVYAKESQISQVLQTRFPHSLVVSIKEIQNPTVL